MSPQAERVLRALQVNGSLAESTRTIGLSIVPAATPDAVRRCLGELRREGFKVERVPGSKLVRLGA